MATAEGGVVPRPGHVNTEGPKTLGTLNIIFGTMLIILGFCTVGFLAIGPALFGGMEKVAKEVVVKNEARQKDLAKQYDDRIAQAKNDEEKKQIEDEKTSVVASQPQVTIDFSMFSGVFKDPKIMRVSYVGALTGLALHIALFVSGIGLIRLTPWGRSLALWWSGLQFIQVIALLIVTIIVVLPLQRATTNKMLDEIAEQVMAKGKGPTIDPNAINFMKSMTALQLPIAIGQSLVGCIYPIVLLFLLNTSDVRAACQPRKPKSGPSDLSDAIGA